MKALAIVAPVPMARLATWLKWNSVRVGPTRVNKDIGSAPNGSILEKLNKKTLLMHNMGESLVSGATETN